MLIVAQARAIKAVCVTANVTEFKRVPGLKVENWLA
jgi:predicted nucleic acid-binding protein